MTGFRSNRICLSWPDRSEVLKAGASGRFPSCAVPPLDGPPHYRAITYRAITKKGGGQERSRFQQSGMSLKIRCFLLDFARAVCYSIITCEKGSILHAYFCPLSPFSYPGTGRQKTAESPSNRGPLWSVLWRWISAGSVPLKVGQAGFRRVLFSGDNQIKEVHGSRSP